MQREKPPEWREKQKGSRGIRRGQRYRLVFQFPIRELASWISVVLLIIYLSGKNHVLTAAFLCFAWTAFWVLFLL
ncbi:hypothetical protein CT824_23745, partial [Salmonella enterica]|nr:hypothetical protein [Salmonella enterica]